MLPPQRSAAIVREQREKGKQDQLIEDPVESGEEERYKQHKRTAVERRRRRREKKSYM